MSPMTPPDPDRPGWRALPCRRCVGDVRWQAESRFDLIRVPDPEAGEWLLEGAVGEESRINVASPLHLRTANLPTTLYLGFDVPVEAWITHDGGPFEGEDLTLSVALQDAEGKVQSRVVLEPEAGRYRGRLPAPALTGNAHLVIRAESEALKRQRTQAVNVLPAIGAVHRPRAGRVVLAAEHPALHRNNTEIHGELQGERLAAEPVGSGAGISRCPSSTPRSPCRCCWRPPSSSTASARRSPCRAWCSIPRAASASGWPTWPARRWRSRRPTSRERSPAAAREFGRAGRRPLRRTGQPDARDGPGPLAGGLAGRSGALADAPSRPAPVGRARGARPGADGHFPDSAPPGAAPATPGGTPCVSFWA